MPPNSPELPPRENRPKLWGFVSVPVPEGPSRYRTAGFLLKALAWLVLATGILFMFVMVFLSFVFLFVGAFSNAFFGAISAFFGGSPDAVFGGALVLFLLFMATVAVALTLGVIALVNLAYLRWAYREPGALAWARGVSLGVILWNVAPLVAALSSGRTEELTAMLTGVPIGLILLGTGLWLLVLTFDPEVERALEAGSGSGGASFEVVDPGEGRSGGA